MKIKSLEELLKYRDNLKFCHSGITDKNGDLIYRPNSEYNIGLCQCDDGYLCEHRTKYLAKHPELLNIYK